MTKDDLTKLSKRERKEYVKVLKEKQSGSEKKTRFLVLGAISFVVLVALVGLFFLSNQKQRARPADLGVAEPVDPVNGREHIDVGQKVASYTSNPPTSGPHYNAPGFGPIACKAYDTEVSDQGVIHNLEHGGIWISYKDKNNTSLKKELDSFAEKNTKVVVSPRPKDDSEIAVAAWGRLLKLNSFDGQKIQDFIDLYKNSSNAPEPIAGCG